MRSIWRFTLIAALVGGGLPLVIFVTSLVPGVMDFWMWHEMIIYVWPTFLIMLGFAGPKDLQFWGALALSVGLNALIYSIGACAIYGLLRLTYRNQS